MGKEFGNLYKMRGIITYRLSPFEQKAFGGMFTDRLANTIRRIRENILIVAPPFMLGYLIYNWSKNEHERLKRKNPADYENDE